MNALHTPGPWKTSPPIDEASDLFAEEYWFIEGPGSDVHGHMNAHDARLIASAPDLLQALRYIEGMALCDEVRDLPNILQTAQAAIARATGSAS